jgi:hypothetical protein
VTPPTELIAGYLDDPDAGWSMGTPGAIAEFVRLPGEPAWRLDDGVVTGHGGIRISAPPGCRALAYQTPVGPQDHWNHAVALCLPEHSALLNHGARPEHSARIGSATVVTEIGPDAEPLRPQDADAVLFDLGLGTPTVQACVRTTDPDLLDALRAACGTPLFAPGSTIAARLVVAGPHRVFRTALGRIEVYTAIPPRGGRSPDGPHTHLLPELLRAGRTHQATVPVPAGHLPCAHLYPAHPLTDVTGRPVPLDAGRFVAFERLLDRHGDPDQRRLDAAVRAAVTAGDGPDRVPRPGDPPGRAALTVALRKLAHTGATPAVLDRWRRTDPGLGDLLDHDGDRNAG